MFNFCKDNIKGINFIYLSKDEVDATRAKFAERLNNIKTIPGARSFHKFIPITPNEIGVKTRIYAKLITLGIMSLYQNP